MEVKNGLAGDEDVHDERVGSRTTTFPCLGNSVIRVIGTLFLSDTFFVLWADKKVKKKKGLWQKGEEQRGGEGAGRVFSRKPE